MSKNILSVDIGGTYIKWGILDENLNILKQDKYETNAKELKGIGIVKSIANLAHELHKEYEIEAVGISIPGNVNSDEGSIILETKNLPESTNLQVKRIFKAITNLPVYMDNDVNVAVLGEFLHGSLKDTTNSVMITVGTGIGGGIIINKKIYRGSNYGAGEVGRQSFLGTTWERMDSVLNFLKRVELGFEKKLTGEEFFEAIQTNNKLKQFLDLYYDELARGIANILVTLDPECITIGGGITEEDMFKVEKIKEHMYNYLPAYLVDSFKLVKAKLGNDAALYGCVELVRQKQSQEN